MNEDTMNANRVKGNREVVVTSEAGEGVHVRGRFSEVRFAQTPSPDEDPREALGRPFWFTLLPSGELREFRYSRDTSSDTRALLLQVMAALQLVTPGAP